MNSKSSDSKQLLYIEDLCVQYQTDYGTVEAVEHLSLSLGDRQTLGLVGETGAGKTTLALAIMGLLPKRNGKIASGKIYFDEQLISEFSDQEMRSFRGDQIAMIFQDPMTSLDPVMPVIDQVMEMILLHKKVSKIEARKLALEALSKVGIKTDRAEGYPHSFSGGMKQRVVIAIALACNPRLIIADEPTTALDVTIQAQVLDLMKKLKDDLGTSMILITHDLGVVGEICDTVAIMYFGSLVEYGNKTEVYQNPLHPYTLGLFHSIPDIFEENAEHLPEIPGFPPQPASVIHGCPFHPRCTKAMDICSKEIPPVSLISHQHYVRCFLYGDEATGKELS